MPISGGPGEQVRGLFTAARLPPFQDFELRAQGLEVVAHTLVARVFVRTAEIDGAAQKLCSFRTRERFVFLDEPCASVRRAKSAARSGETGPFFF